MINSNMQQSIKIENFWIIVVWVFIFTTVLTWDQEKIVVLNLILFSYFLYCLASERIFSVFGARKSFLLNSMLVTLKTQASMLLIIVTEVSTFISCLNHLVLTVLKKTLSYVTLIITNVCSVSFDILNPHCVFEIAQLSLNLSCRHFILKGTHLNLFASAAIIAAIEPTFESVSDHNVEP